MHHTSGDTKTEFTAYSVSSPFVGESVSSTLNPDIPAVSAKVLPAGEDIAGPNATLTNELNLTEITFKKVWDDNHNRDNTREKVTYTITPANGVVAPGTTVPDAETTVSVDGEKGEDDLYKATGDTWSNTLYLPTLKADKVSNPAAVYTVTEDTPKKYSVTSDSPKWVWSETEKSCTITNKLAEEQVLPRQTITFKGTKQFDEDAYWKNITRPTVSLRLYYLEKGQSALDNANWKEITAANYAQFCNDQAAVGDADPGLKTVTIDADGTGSVTWTNLYKYWPREESEYGHPELIRYKVEEVVTPATTAGAEEGQENHFSYLSAGTAPNMKVDSNSYEQTITNTLQLKKIYVHKDWKTGTVSAKAGGFDVTPDAQASAVSKDVVQQWINVGAIPPSALTFTLKYSTDGGKKWTDYPSSDKKTQYTFQNDGFDRISCDPDHRRAAVRFERKRALVQAGRGRPGGNGRQAGLQLWRK